MWLKQSTTQVVTLGPFISDVDSKSVVNNLTLAASDVLICKHGVSSAYTAKNDTTAPTFQSAGCYAITLNATDLSNRGRFRVLVNKTGALCTWQDFLVVDPTVYDALVVGTGYAPVNVMQWLGGAPNALVSGRIDASAGAVVDKTDYRLSTQGAADIIDAALTEPVNAFSWSSSPTLRKAIAWMAAFFSNKQTMTATTGTLRNSADAGNIATSTLSDDNVTTVRGAWS